MIVVRGKVWGNTSTIFNKFNTKIARIEVHKGGYCSNHKHANNFNMFFVETGKLKITIYRNDAGMIIEDITILGPCGMTYVEPTLLHSFEALEDTVAYEIYWVEMNDDDIHRETAGGMKNAGDGVCVQS